MSSSGSQLSNLSVPAAVVEELIESHSAQPPLVPALRSPRWWLWPAQASLLVLVLYFVLRPENYGLTPNGLDPFFYSGYAINFDDLLHGVGRRWYFVSRWSVYIPGMVLYKIAGPILGRLLLRWMLATLVVTMLWRLGRRWNWTSAQRVLIGTVAVTMPMFVRPLFTDYTEYLMVALGIPLVCICLRERQTAVTVLAIGVLSALLLVSNPVTIIAVVPPLILAVLFGSSSWRGRLAIGAGVGSFAFATIVAGLLFFRWRYGLPNVYQPTLDYVRNSPGADPLKSPRLEWLGRFTWLYGPPILIAVAVGAAQIRRERVDRTERLALSLCAIQYIIQWFDQFIRDGNGLEISYYWCYSYPSFVVALAIVLGRLTRSASNLMAYAVGALWLCLLVAGVPNAIRLPAGIWFVAVAILVVFATLLVSRHRPLLSAVALLGLLAWTQIGAPPYDPLSYHPYNMSPNYDLLYRQAGNLSERMYEEAVWFEDKMDLVPSDEFSSFVPLGEGTNSIIGIYAPHVVERVLQPTLSPAQMMSRALRSRPAGAPLIIALYGTAEEVADRMDMLRLSLNLGPAVLDVVHSSAMGYRLVVFERTGESYLPFTWTADLLTIGAGSLTGSSITGVPANEPGFLSGGPFTWLSMGDYQVTLTYSSTDAPNWTVGQLTVASPEKGEGPQMPLTGTGGIVRSVVLDFTVKEAGGRWEFRTTRNGGATISVESVTLDRVSSP